MDEPIMTSNFIRKKTKKNINFRHSILLSGRGQFIFMHDRMIYRIYVDVSFE